MVVPKTYLIQVNEGDLESFFDRCIERAFRKRIASIPVEEGPDSDELLTPEEAARLLKVSKVTVWAWSKPSPGILNPRRIGNQVRYLRSEVMAAARPTKGGVPA